VDRAQTTSRLNKPMREFSILSELFPTTAPGAGTPLTWMPHQTAYLIASAVTVLAAWLATRDHENPFRRWVKILGSAGVVCLVLRAMGHFQAVRSPVFVGIADKQAYGEAVEMVLCACLGAIVLWAGTISGIAANLVTGILDPTEEVRSAPDLRPVEALMRQDRNREALAQLKRLGAKGQASLLLKARIHESLGQLSEARAIYKRILRNPGEVSQLAASTLLARLG
jgi:hypothetical protein